MDAHSTSRRTGCKEGRSSCRVFPFLPLTSLVVLVAGIPVWVMYSYSAASSTLEALSTTTADQAAVQAALSSISTLRFVVLGLAVAAVVVVLALTIAHALRCRRPAGVRPAGLRTLAAADGFTTFLLWLLLLGAVALIALTATWFLGSLAADAMLNQATRYSENAEKAAVRAVSSAQALVEQVKVTQLGALDNAPPEVKDTQWFKDFRLGVSNFNQTVMAAAGSPSSENCKPGCFSLDFLAGLAGLNSTCICVLNTIHGVQQKLHATQEATMLSLVGLGLVYLATSLLLLYFASTYTGVRRDIQESKRGGYSTSSGPAQSGSADASIDIRAADGLVKTAIPTANCGTRHQHPFAQQVAVAADARDPRDTSRLPTV